MDEFGPSLPAVEGGPETGRLQGTFRQPANIPMERVAALEPMPGAKEEDISELQKALKVIEAHLAQKHPFSNRQVDIGVKLILSKLRDEQVSKIKEVAASHKRPLWHTVAGWYIFAEENGMAYSPIFESNWPTETETEADMVRCKNCNEGFIPARFGQVVCGSVCGVALDKKLIAERVAQQEKISLAV